MKHHETKQHIHIFEKSAREEGNTHSKARKVIYKNNKTSSTTECVIKLFKGSITTIDREYYPIKDAI